MNNVMVSVVLAIYKDDGFFDEALQSILQQTYKNLEVIIVANNCDDKVWNKIIKYSEQDGRIVPLRLKMGGLAFALNYGIEAAKGSYIARMDADDICLENRIEKQMDFLLKNLDVDILGTQIEYIDSHGFVIQKGWTQSPEMHQEILNFLKYRCALFHPTVVFKKDAIINIGGYKYGFYGEDYEIWIRAALAGLKFHNLKEVLLKYRIHDNQMSTVKAKNSIQLLLNYYWKQTGEFGYWWGSQIYSKYMQYLIVHTTKLRKFLKGNTNV